MIFQKGMTLQEFERINNLNLYELFEQDCEGTSQNVQDPDAFIDWLGYNSQDIMEEAIKG